MADRTKEKRVEFTAGNSSKDIQKLKDARAKIRQAKSDTSRTLFGTLLGIAGLFNIGLGITSSCFNGATAGRAAYLSRCETVYTGAIELLLEHNDPNKSGYVPYVRIAHDFLGTYQGSNKEYVYKATKVTYYEGHI